MKIKCINVGCWRIYLTVDKTYDVIKEDGVYYYLIDDKGRENWHWKYFFKTLSELRNEKIKKLLR